MVGKNWNLMKIQRGQKAGVKLEANYQSELVGGKSNEKGCMELWNFNIASIILKSIFQSSCHGGQMIRPFVLYSYSHGWVNRQRQQRSDRLDHVPETSDTIAILAVLIEPRSRKVSSLSSKPTECGTAGLTE